jgi:hypothetical protein
MKAQPAERSIIDISVPVRPGMPVFRGNPDVELSLQQSIEAGDEANVSFLSLGVHTGTRRRALPLPEWWPRDETCPSGR